MVRMEVLSVGVVPESDSIVVLLREMDGKRLLAMDIGAAEANAIALAVEGIQPPRPLTHDLLCNILEHLQAHVDRVAVVRVDDRIFYGRITLATQHGLLDIDARPSDAIALALRQEAPIFAAERVLAAAGFTADDDTEVH